MRRSLRHNQRCQKGVAKLACQNNCQITTKNGKTTNKKLTTVSKLVSQLVVKLPARKEKCKRRQTNHQTGLCQNLCQNSPVSKLFRVKTCLVSKECQNFWLFAVDGERFWHGSSAKVLAQVLTRGVLTQVLTLLGLVAWLTSCLFWHVSARASGGLASFDTTLFASNGSVSGTFWRLEAFAKGLRFRYALVVSKTGRVKTCVKLKLCH